MASADEIKEQLDNILRQVAEIQNIANFEIHPSTDANYGDGFVAQFYTGEICDSDTGETTVVAIKKAPDFKFEMINYNPIFRNESSFYSTLLPALDELQKEMGISEPFNNIPTYFCSGLESKKEFIAMENLKPFGYVMFDKKQYLNKEHLENLFKLYGKFHALSYVLRNKDVEKYQKIAKEFSDVCKQLVVDFMGTQITSAVSAAVKSLDSDDDKVVLEELKDFGQNVVQTLLEASAYNGKHSCLIHGDCWSNNMLFKYSESGKLLDIKLIDFQLCKDSTPIHDLSYFFYSGASKEDFDNLDEYLEIYHKSFSEFATQLGANHEELLSLDVLKNEWKDNALFGVIMGIYLWQIKLVPKETFTDIIDPDQELPSMEEGLKLWEALMDKVHKTDEYKERTTAILRHAFEYGVVNKNKIVRNNK